MIGLSMGGMLAGFPFVSGDPGPGPEPACWSLPAWACCSSARPRCGCWYFVVTNPAEAEVSHTGDVPEQESTFALQPAVLRRTLMDGNLKRHPESHFLDFVVDGESLAARVAPWIDFVSINLVTPLNRAWLPAVPDAVEVLLGRRPAAGLTAGRVALLVCGECGDLGCGAITASLGLNAGSVSWHDFRWERDNAEPPEVLDGLGPIAFRRDDYKSTLRAAHQRIAEMPYDRLAHDGRRFLWPWQWGWRLPRQQ